MTAILLTSCLTLLATPQEPGQPSQLDEVVANVRRQPLGAGTLDDLALPEDLLRRLSDRILRRSYEDHFRIVIAAPVPAQGAADATALAASGSGSAASEPGDRRSAFSTVLDVLALVAAGVLAILGFFAWKARRRRSP